MGGQRHGTSGYYIQPTIFTDVKPQARIMKEEIFGVSKSVASFHWKRRDLTSTPCAAQPVLVVTKFKDQEDLIRMANDTVYGLAAAVHTTNLNKAITTAAALKAGTVWVTFSPTGCPGGTALIYWMTRLTASTYSTPRFLSADSRSPEYVSQQFA